MDGSYEKRWYGVAVLSIILTIVSIDNTVLDVALPSISSELGATAKDLQWLIDIYILVFTSLLLTVGAISDRYGRRMMLQLGVVVFGAASLGAALSTTIEELIAYRGLTGLGGAMMMPSTLSIITDMFRDPEERQKAIAVWGMMFGIGFGVGPLLGGWLVDDFGWQWVFYINIPIVIIAFILGWIWLRESKDETTPKADFLGMGLSIVGLFTMVFAIIEAGMHGWSDKDVLMYFAVAVVFMALFLIYETKVSQPMLPLKLFRNPSFWVSSVALTMAMFGMMGAMFFFSQLLQTVQGYSALTTGLMLIPLTVGVMLGSGVAPGVTKKYKMSPVVSIGILVAAISLIYFAFFLSTDMSKWHVMVGFFLLGLGFGIAMVPVTDSIMGAIPEEKLGVGSAMNDTTRELGGALSIAILGSLVNNKYIEAIKSSDIAHMLQEPVAASIQSAHIVAAKTADTHITDVADTAFLDGLGFALYIGAAITIASALLTWQKLPNTIIKSKLD